MSDFGERYLLACANLQSGTDYIERRRRLAKDMYPDDTEDVALCKLEYRLESGLELNLETPQTFGEKLNYMKLFDRNPDYPRIVDKYEVREYVSKRIGSKYLNEIFYSSKNAQTIPFSDLPQ